MLSIEYFNRAEYVYACGGVLRRMKLAIWTLAGLYVLVGIGLFYSLAIDSDELFLTVTAAVFALMGPMAYLVYKKQISDGE